MARAPRKKAKKLGRGKRFATGIDIGTYSIKIITMAGDDAGAIDLAKVTVVPLVPPAKPEEQGQRLERQRQGLKEALKKHGKLMGKVVLGFPRQLATTRYVNFPSSNRDEIREMLVFDVERHVPFAVDELEMGYEKIAQLGDHETRLLMVCAPRKEIIPYVEMALESGLSIDVLDLDVLGDCAAYKRSLRGNETLGIVNFGRSSVNFSVFQNEIMIFSRSIPVPETFLLSRFPGAKSLADLRGRVTIHGPIQPMEKKHYEEWILRLGTELKRCIRAFECENTGRKINRLIYCGGAAFFPAGPPQGLLKYTQIPPVVEPPLNGELPSSSEYRGAELSVAAGLALRGIYGTPDSLNLIPRSYVEEQRQKQQSVFRKNMAIFVFMMIALFGGTAYLKWHLNHSNYTQLNSFYQNLRKEATEINTMKNVVKNVETYLDKQHSCTNVLTAVMKILQTQRCYVSKITFTKGRTLEIKGQVLTEAVFQEISRELNKLVFDEVNNPNGFFTYIYPRSSVKPLSLDPPQQLTVQEFEFTCSLKTSDTSPAARR